MPARRLGRLLGCAVLCAGVLAASRFHGVAPAWGAEASGKTMWDLTELYPTPEAWAADYEAAKTLAGTLAHYQGTLGSNAATLLQALDNISQVKRRSARLYSYASLMADEDVGISRNQERKQQAGALYTLIGERTA